MSIIQAIVLGIIQGLTEFLPVSSTAHLVVIPRLVGWTSSAEFTSAMESFDVALHVGTLFAVILCFWKDWVDLIKNGFKLVFDKKFKEEKDKNKEHKKDYKTGKMFWYIVAATIPGGIIGYLLDKFLGEKLQSNTTVIAFALIILGIILYIVDKYGKNKKKMEDMTIKDSLIIGISQCLAFIPGVSRSGITITTARKLDIDRESAAKFSFLLSTPIIFGAAILKVKDFQFDQLFFYVGVLVSFVVGLLAIKFMLKHLQKSDYKIFAIYRVLFGLIILLTFGFKLIS